MERYLTENIKKDLETKIVLVSGPRQVGKTTLSKLISDTHDYLNHDSPEDRLQLLERNWDRQKPLIIFDELHKMDNWKGWLKGIFDTESIPPRILVTGSARLDIFRKVGDSLAGRYFPYRLYPLDLKEIQPETKEMSDVLERLLLIGGFPEPFLKGELTFYNRWRRTHIDIILRQDLIDFTEIKNLRKIETLVELLRNRVASPLSYASLARDLNTSSVTIKRWIELLEELFIIFRVYPYHRNIARSLQKTPKYYFFDNGQVRGDGPKLENLVACSLLKEIDFRKDCYGEDWKLSYLRTKDGHEVDFLLLKNELPHTMIEVKWSEDGKRKNLDLFSKQMEINNKLILVKELKKEKSYLDGIQIKNLGHWLTGLQLQDLST